MRKRVAGWAVGLVTLGACARSPAPPSAGPPASLASPFAGYTSPRYEDPSAWLCLPGRVDACAASLEATELLPDGGRVVVREAPVPGPGADKVDCFYVYPTVDLSLSPANHTSFESVAPMASATVAQAARFQTACRLYVPLYRQATLGVYLRSHEVRDRYLAVAASDVVDAFAHYMASYNGGRKVVLIGHSQGAEMVTRLLKRYFDDDPLMRDRLLLAMPIGGRVEVPAGQTVGGTFAHLPTCSRAGETGCVVAYRSFIAGATVPPDDDPPAVGLERACVDPSALDRGPGSPLSRAFFPLREESRLQMRGVEGVRSPWIMLRDFYRAACVDGPRGARYLAVSSAPKVGDVRESPINLESRWFRGKLGLHVLDLQFAQGDLVDLVARRAAALR